MSLLRLLCALGLILSGLLLLPGAKRAFPGWRQGLAILLIFCGIALVLTRNWTGAPRFFAGSPLSNPVALPALTPTASPLPATVIATLYHSCLRWDQVTATMDGQQACVYGIVTDHSENARSQLTNLYFGPREIFFFVSTYHWEESYAGRCIVANGKVQLNTYKTPYIKIDEIASCQAWMK